MSGSGPVDLQCGIHHDAVYVWERGRVISTPSLSLINDFSPIATFSQSTQGAQIRFFS